MHAIFDILVADIFIRHCMQKFSSHFSADKKIAAFLHVCGGVHVYLFGACLSCNQAKQPKTVVMKGCKVFFL